MTHKIYAEKNCANGKEICVWIQKHHKIKMCVQFVLINKIEGYMYPLDGKEFGTASSQTI